MSLASRVGATAKDPWLGLTATVIGGVAWAAGVVTVGPAVAVGAAAYAVGAVVGGLLGGDRVDENPYALPPERELELPTIREGTEQKRLVDNLSRYIDDLRALRESDKPDPVVDPSIEALVAAENAYGSAVRVAAAVDGLDTAITRSGPATAGASINQQVREAVQRMNDRRNALLIKLNSTVDEIAEVYTKLLEMSATVSSLDAGVGATEEVAKVNDSLDHLRRSLAELEDQAQRPG